jgi:hypothetical protein
MQFNELLDDIEFTEDGIIEITRKDILDQVAGGSSEQLMQEMNDPLSDNGEDAFCGQNCTCNIN